MDRTKLLNEFSIPNKDVYTFSFLDSEHILLSVYDSLILFGLRNDVTRDFKGPFLTCDMQAVPQLVGKIVQQWVYLNPSEKLARKKWPAQIHYDPEKEWLCIAFNNHQSVIYELKSGNTIMTMGRPYYLERDDAPVKSLFYGKRSLCITRPRSSFTNYSSLHFWQSPPLSIESGSLTIEQALFVVLIHILKQGPIRLSQIPFKPGLGKESLSQFNEWQVQFLRNTISYYPQTKPGLWQ